MVAPLCIDIYNTPQSKVFGITQSPKSFISSLSLNVRSIDITTFHPRTTTYIHLQPHTLTSIVSNITPFLSAPRTLLLSLKMGISHSTARYLAPLSFLIDFVAQQYGMLASPNMKDVNDANLSFFSPQPYLIAAFFFPQQIFQCVWLWRLWKSKTEGGEGEVQGKETKTLLDFVPFYVVANLCLACELFCLLFVQVQRISVCWLGSSRYVKLECEAVESPSDEVGREIAF